MRPSAFAVGSLWTCLFTLSCREEQFESRMPGVDLQALQGNDAPGNQERGDRYVDDNRARGHRDDDAGGGNCLTLPIRFYYADRRDAPPNSPFVCGNSAEVYEDAIKNGRNDRWFNDGDEHYQYNMGFDSYRLGVDAEVEGDIEYSGKIEKCPLPDRMARYHVDITYANLPLTVWDQSEFRPYLDCICRPDLPPEDQADPEDCPPYAKPLLGAGRDGSGTLRWRVDLIGPTDQPIPFMLTLFFGIVEGWGVEGGALDYWGTGTLTEHAAEFGFTPGAVGGFYDSYAFGTLGSADRLLGLIELADTRLVPGAP